MSYTVNDQNLPLRNVRWQGHLVCLATIKVILVGIHETHEILRADVRCPHNHARRVHGVAVVERRPGIEGPRAGWRQRFEALPGKHRRRRLEVVTTLPQHVGPYRTRVVGPTGIFGGTPIQRPPGGVAHGRCVGENLAHPGVRIERLALHDANGRQLTQEFRIKNVAGSSCTSSLSISK